MKSSTPPPSPGRALARGAAAVLLSCIAAATWAAAGDVPDRSPLTRVGPGDAQDPTVVPEGSLRFPAVDYLLGPAPPVPPETLTYTLSDCNGMADTVTVTVDVQ